MERNIIANFKGCIINSKNLKLGDKKIASDAYGDTVEGEWEGSLVAVKIIDPILYQEWNGKKVKKEFLSECEKLNVLHHPNIIQFFGIYMEGSPVPGLVMEQFDWNLNDLLNQNIVLSHEIKSHILYQVALGLRYLHTRTPAVIHCNLSSKSIAISKSMVAKITDSTMARMFTVKPNFMVPEVTFRNSKYTDKSDIFSFGCIMLHAYTELLPKIEEVKYSLDTATNKCTTGVLEIDTDMLQNNIAVVKTKTSNLIKNCLENSEQKRPSITEIIDHFEKNLSPRLKFTSTGICGTPPHLQYFEGVDKATSENIKWWKNMKPNWKKCKDLPENYCWVISIAELNEKVYIAIRYYNKDTSKTPYVYDIKQDKWSRLHSLPLIYFSLVAVPRKGCIMAMGGMEQKKMRKEVFTLQGDSWSKDYPDMLTARCRVSSISYGPSVIVAGGITKEEPLTITKAVEVLKIHDKEWYIVDQLPHVMYSAIPLISEDTIYLGVGYDSYIKVAKGTAEDDSTRSIIKASLSDLLQSDNKNTVSKSTWIKLPDMPYSSWSITHYKNKLIAITGDSLVQPVEKENVVCQTVPLVYVYNSHTFSWDCVDDLSGTIEFFLGRSIRINETTIFFVGGVKGTHSNATDMVTDCYTLKFEP